MARRRITTKDIGLLHQLYEDNQLNLAPEFQRLSVWPRAAKAYLVDTILSDLPISPLLFQRGSSTQSGRPTYDVIDGQQRLRAVFLFLENKLRITEPSDSKRHGKRFSDLTSEEQERLLDYDFIVQELSGYSKADVQDIFTRANKYTVSLSQQELRNAKAEGRFAEFVEAVGAWDFWSDNKVFTKSQMSRMRNVEFAAELAILLSEGPQDKKTSIDTWYLAYREEFPQGAEIQTRLREYLGWVGSVVTELSKSRFRRPVDLYALVGAIDQVTVQGETLDDLDSASASEGLSELEDTLKDLAKSMKDPFGAEQPKDSEREAARYLLASSRQTDNIRPRQTRLEILADVIG